MSSHCNARNTLLNTFPNTASLSKVLSTDECTIGAVPITKILCLGYRNSAFSTGVRTLIVQTLLKEISEWKNGKAGHSMSHVVKASQFLTVHL